MLWQAQNEMAEVVRKAQRGAMPLKGQLSWWITHQLVKQLQDSIWIGGNILELIGDTLTEDVSGAQQ